MRAAPLDRAKLSLEGLSVGDAFGERFFGLGTSTESLIARRALPRSPWRYTDDTVMSISIVEVLRDFGLIEQDELARRFAERWAADPSRGYGATAHQILRALGEGYSWRDVSPKAFNGEGSMGNGAAMRAGPIGAYFADDADALIDAARESAEVTHAHRDAQAGAIAVALAAGHTSRGVPGHELLKVVWERTPESLTRSGLLRAAELPRNASIDVAIHELGNGSRVCSYDTVPFALWCAARHWDYFEEAMWVTVAGLGDRDTTCAIVGSVVAMAVGQDGIPVEWRRSREALPDL